MSKSDDGNKSLTSSNKWTYVPGKVFNLKPLNIQDLKKELLDSSSSDDAEDSDNDENKAELKESDISKILNESFNEGCLSESEKFEAKTSETSIQSRESVTSSKPNEQTNGIQMQTRSRRSNGLEPLLEETMEISKIPSPYPTKVAENKENMSENIVSNIEPLNLSRDRKKNDSFDLDFSALSIHTPVKKVVKNFNYQTPKINIIPSSASKSLIKSASLFPGIKNNQEFSNFKTPLNKVMHPSISSIKRHYDTPYSTGKHAVHNQNQYNNVFMETLENQKVKPVIYLGEDGFKRISVNNIEYIVLNTLGKGGSSEVVCGFNIEENLHVAIKLVSLSDNTTREGFINEVKLLQSLQTCDRIIKMYDYEIRDDKLIVVLEKGGEDLSTILKRLATKQSHLPTYMLFFYWMEMLYSVKQIHANGVIHSDLKPANFLKAEGGLKLIDFGIASKVQEDMTCVFKTYQEGSCNYMSPEALNLQSTGGVDSPNFGKPKYRIHFKSDVWSLGCILYQLVYRKTPFQHINQIYLKLGAITDPNHKIPYPHANWVSPRIVNTIKRCLQHDIKARPSIDELIEEYERLLKTI